MRRMLRWDAMVVLSLLPLRNVSANYLVPGLKQKQGSWGCVLQSHKCFHVVLTMRDMAALDIPLYCSLAPSSASSLFPTSSCLRLQL